MKMFDDDDSDDFDPDTSDDGDAFPNPQPNESPIDPPDEFETADEILGQFAQSQNSYFSLLDSGEPDSPYFLISSSELNFGDITGQFQSDASEFYNNESAAMIFFTGKDQLTDFVPSMESIEWGTASAVAGAALGFGVGLALDPAAAYSLMEAGADIGFEAGMEGHEIVEDFENRGSALFSLFENDRYSPSSDEYPTPQPNYSPDQENKSQVGQK
jgi:hypothetical protein